MVYLENTFFLSLKTLSRLPVMYITFWFKAFSIMSDFFLYREDLRVGKRGFLPLYFSRRS